jgi:hypothetical protein
MPNNTPNTHEFQVRDNRGQDQFRVDNEWLDSYAKYFGPVGSMVYFALCRHANRGQEAWPSIQTIAEEIGTGESTVRKYLAYLAQYHIIAVGRKRHPETKRWLNNVYVLLDKREWVMPDYPLHLKKPVDNLGHRYQIAMDPALDSTAMSQRYQIAQKTNKKTEREDSRVNQKYPQPDRRCGYHGCRQDVCPHSWNFCAEHGGCQECKQECNQECVMRVTSSI